MSVTIYALIDKANNKPFYVGSTILPFAVSLSDGTELLELEKVESDGSDDAVQFYANLFNSYGFSIDREQN
jgi:hypothetical protein